MKKILFFLFITISSISFSQTLEERYTSEAYNVKPRNFTFLTESNLYYLTMSVTNSEISIYNSNHTLYKTVSLIIPENYIVEQIFFATDKLFNSDSKIEILVGTAYPAGGYIRKMLLFNEDGGNNIFDFGDKVYVDVFKDNNNNYKLITSHNFTYDVYSLLGTLTVSQENFLIQQKVIGFPNPSSNTINITNPLINNEKDNIQVYDINGRKVIEKVIVGNGEQIKIDISNLSKGVYIYKIRDYGNKFIKE